MVGLVEKIEIVLSYFKDLNTGMGRTIYQKYYQLKKELEEGCLKSNPINGSVRAYLDAFNDWDNPILVIMGELENDIETMVKSNK